MIKTWFKIFYRNAGKNWLNILINILGLTLGFAVLLLVLLYANDEKSYNAWNPDKDHIFKVIHKMSDGDIWGTSSAIEGEYYKEEIPEVEGIYLSDGWYDDNIVKVNGESKYTKKILEGESDFFDFFPFEIVQGSVKAFKEAKDHIAISQKTAISFFKKESAIGKNIEIEGKNYLVSTVFKGNSKSYFNPNLVLHFTEEVNKEWGNFSSILFCKLKKGASVKEVEKKMDKVFEKYRFIPNAKKEGISLEEYKNKSGLEVKLEKLTDIRLHTHSESAGPEGKGDYLLILIMLGLSILLIVISCVNFINLSTASASQRAKEVGVKKTLGLSKTTLTRQYIFEILLQGFVAFLLSLTLVEMILPYYNDFLEKDISLLDRSTLIDVSIIALLVSLFVGSIPAVYLSNFKAVEVLKGNTSRSKNGIFIRNVMLGLQFLISGFFLIGAFVIYEQVAFMLNKDLGFSGDQILVVRMNNYRNNRYKIYKTLKKEMIKYPGIEEITSNFYVPGGGMSSSTSFEYKNKEINANANAVDFNYLNLLNIKILKGRGLSEKFASDTISNIMINETAAKGLGIYNDPVGKKVQIGFGGVKNKNVIGMVKDYYIEGFDKKISPMFIMHWKTYKWMESNMHSVQFKVKPEHIDETIKYIENYWVKNVEQGYPFEYNFLNKQFQKTFKKYQKQKLLFMILTSIVVIISLLGLFALATLTIQQRLKEVAIRKTLGASVYEIMYQLIKSFVIIVLYASALLIPLSYYAMQKWLDNFAYRIDMPLWPYIFTPVLLIILVISVVGIKAYNTTKIDLIKYLKAE